MPIASPSDLNPRAWLNPNAGTYNGSNQLTALTNGGTDGGSFSIAGTPAKGTAIGALQVLRIDSIAKQLTLSLATISSGTMSVVFVGKLLSAGINGILGLDWPGGGSAKAFYADVGAGDSFAFGNACCSVDALHAPSFYSAAGALSDTNFHVLHWQLGTTNGLWRDNVAQAITGGSNASAPGAMPATGAQIWDFGCADPSSETANADIAAILIFDYALTTQQRTDLYDWYQSQASGAISGSASITEAADTVASVGTLAITGQLGRTEASDTSSSAGRLAITGSLAKTDAGDAVASIGALAIAGAAAITEASDTLVAAGGSVNTGTAQILEAGDVVMSAGALEPLPGPVLRPGGIPSRSRRYHREITRYPAPDDDDDVVQSPAEATVHRLPKPTAKPKKAATPKPAVRPIDTHDDEEEEALALLLVA